MGNAALTIFLCWMMISTAKCLSSTNGIESTKELAQEYCQFEIFRPQCSKGEVILMESATYGRMRVGKCIDAKEIETLGYLGCSVDVVSLFDENCSGKSVCEVRVSDISSRGFAPCVSGLNVHLEATFQCIRVADEGRGCTVAVSETPVHVDISKSISICGTESQSWTIEAPVGQRLVVSLLDLTPSKSREAEGIRCIQRGTIVDASARRNVSVCGGRSQRQRQLYASTGNVVKIYLERQASHEEKQRIFSAFLKFEAVGCSDIVPSEDNWLKRRDDVIVIGCYSSRQTWQLNCIAGKWVGVIGNCSKETSKTDYVSESLEQESTLTKKAQVLAIVSICGFTLAISFIIICIGALCLRRFYIQSKSKSDYRTLNYESAFDKSQKITSEQRMSSDYPTNCPRDSVSGFIPTYSVYSGQESGDNRNGTELKNAIQTNTRLN